MLQENLKKHFQVIESAHVYDWDYYLQYPKGRQHQKKVIQSYGSCVLHIISW